MPQYHFKISDKQGKISTKTYDAPSKERVLILIKEGGFIPISEQDSQTISFIKFKKNINLLDFSENLVSLLEAGIHLKDAFVILEDIQDDEQIKKVLQRLHQGLHEGENIASILREFPNHFSEAYATMVETGEESGKLIEILKNYNDFLANRQKIISFIISSSLYPLFIILMSGAIVIFFLFYMIPKLRSIFEQASNKSFLTNCLLQISNLVDNYFWLLITLFISFLAGSIALWRHHSVQGYLQKISLKIPLLGSFIIMKNIIFFTNSLTVLLKSHIPLIKAVRLSRTTITNSLIKKSLANVENNLQQGEKLSIALQDSLYIAPLMIKMLAVGEETGCIEKTLQRITTKYQAEMQEKTRRALSLLEPLIIVLVGIFIGIIVISIFAAISDATSISI